MTARRRLSNRKKTGGKFTKRSASIRTARSATRHRTRPQTQKKRGTIPKPRTRSKMIRTQTIPTPLTTVRRTLRSRPLNTQKDFFSSLQNWGNNMASGARDGWNALVHTGSQLVQGASNYQRGAQNADHGAARQGNTAYRVGRTVSRAGADNPFVDDPEMDLTAR